MVIGASPKSLRPISIEVALTTAPVPTSAEYASHDESASEPVEVPPQARIAPLANAATAWLLRGVVSDGACVTVPPVDQRNCVGTGVPDPAPAPPPESRTFPAFPPVPPSRTAVWKRLFSPVGMVPAPAVPKVLPAGSNSSRVSEPTAPPATRIGL